MSSTIHVYIDEEDKPTNFSKLRKDHLKNFHFSGVKLPLETGEKTIPCGPPRVYAAFTWGTCGFIVSEYVDGRICDDSDIPLIIAAMQSLIEIPSPPDQTMPGPVGGGIIEHPGFNESESPIWYETVQELEDHLNGIFRVLERPWQISFKKELATYGLRLCPSDTVLANFMRDDKGGVVAVDFAGYSFLPASFFASVIEYSNYSKLRQDLLRNLKYPRAKCRAALAIHNVSLGLAPFGTNNIGKQPFLAPMFETVYSPQRLEKGNPFKA
ncbi:hypothetical protein FA13DRAFT_1737103 [Coprinellus micaceus]|uniref:Aminoglycoside phosphotransferase domain-containing protein n=1 Tax=Coprinellus micaceus TaxID=71717 RepID=A0A4Y7SZL6_COPMI|nr:hypothetical protein FA13DRAFT_1737103 [Coprinellus micaceus]